MRLEWMQLRKFYFFSLYGLVSLALILSLYFQYNFTLQEISLLILIFLLGILYLHVVLKRTEQLTQIKELNKKMVTRLDGTVAQQAQHLKLAALGRFSASIAHELRNPLGAISHAIQLLGEDNSLSEEDERLKQLIIRNCNKMNAVIKNVLQLTRREPSQPQSIQILPFLEQFKQDFCLSNACDLKITVPNKKLNIMFDKSQLEQILVILCDNAIQHGKNDEALISIKVESDEHQTILTVSDNGKGIAKEHYNEIFEPFFTTLRGGTGMGLFIARDLCEMNQASLSLENTKVGSCFAIRINH